SAIVILGQVSKPRLRVREIEDAALIHIARGRAGSGRRKAVLSRDAVSRNVLSRIELECVPYMNDVCADIRARYKQVRRYLPLYSEVPGILSLRVHVRLDRHIRTIGGIYRIAAVESVWEWVPTRISRPRIIQIDTGGDHGEAERRNGGRVQMQILLDEIVADSTADSNCRFAVTRWIPRKRDARIEILVMGIDAGLPIEGWISGICETRRAIRNHG